MLNQDKQGNVTFLISNQSIGINPVDIKILIDGQVAIQGHFDVKGDQLSQHNWQKYRFQLKGGKHTIFISSVKGEALLDGNFEVTGSHTVIIAYWYDPNVQRGEQTKFFTLEIRDQPVRIM